MGSVRTLKGTIEQGEFDEVITCPGEYLNDHCLFFDAGVWHFFGIVGPVGLSCYSGGSEAAFAHFTSADLRAWERHPDVLAVDGTGPDAEHVFAPHVILREGVYHMLYTGVDGARRQRICLATSRDLFAWKRHPHNPVIVPSLYWAKWPGFNCPEGPPSACRDSHVMKLDDGRYIAYWVAEMNAKHGERVTCVAASISDNLVSWQEVGPVLTLNAWDAPPTAAVESPCVVFKDGKYWLFFKHGWSTHFACSDTPYTFMHEEIHRLGYAHAAEVFAWKGEWFITHCSGDPQDYEYKKTNRTKGLYLGRLDWPEGGTPRFAVK